MNSESFGGGWLERNENSPRGKKKKKTCTLDSIRFKRDANRYSWRVVET